MAPGGHHDGTTAETDKLSIPTISVTAGSTPSRWKLSCAAKTSHRGRSVPPGDVPDRPRTAVVPINNALGDLGLDSATLRADLPEPLNELVDAVRTSSGKRRLVATAAHVIGIPNRSSRIFSARSAG
jgi:hypothetical protein